MKLQDYRQDFYTFSGKASDIARQLALAGIAIVWLFKKEEAGQFSVPHDLILPSALIVVCLGLDLLQYVLATIIWRLFYRYKEKQGTAEDAEFHHTPWLERPIWAVFCLKLVCIFAAYVLLFKFLVRALSLA